MRVTLNLATRPFADFTPLIKQLRVAMGILAVAIAGLLFGLHAFHQKAEAARAQEHDLDTRIAAIAHERQSVQQSMAQPDNALVMTEVRALNKLFDEKGFSWTLAMEDLERVLPAGVQVSSIEPLRDKEGKITLHLRVIGPRDRAVELVQNLEHAKRFVLPRIAGENAETTERPGQALQPVSASSRVDFDLFADYNPITQSELREEEKREKRPAESESRPAVSSLKPSPANPAKPPAGVLARSQVVRRTPAAGPSSVAPAMRPGTQPTVGMPHPPTNRQPGGPSQRPYPASSSGGPA